MGTSAAKTPIVQGSGSVGPKLVATDRTGFEIYPDNDKIARRHENTADVTALQGFRVRLIHARTIKGHD
jgi:hypothetical protein